MQPHVGHVSDQNVRSPFQLVRAVVEARFQKYRIIPISGCGPGNQRGQQNGGSMLAQPKPQSVLLVADVIATLAIFAAARTDVRPVGEVLVAGIFLYPLVAAGRSVESI